MAAVATLVVHGGAGRLPRDVSPEVIDAGLESALTAGWAALSQGGSGVDAVASAVRALEDDPVFNAGTGSILTAAGTVELDAAIMDGNGLRVGAVAAVTDLRNPIDLARAVMDDGRHVLIVGRGASRFAAEHRLPLIDPIELVNAARSPKAGDGDTVGAVCLDGSGHLAVAVSTGGTPGQLAGRVGDSPICGAGFYADDLAGAACATGEGEGFIRIVACKRVADLLAAGAGPQAAADQVIEELGTRVRARGGLIVVDRAGTVGIAHNSAHMSWAWRDDQGGGRWSDPLPDPTSVQQHEASRLAARPLRAGRTASTDTTP
jgi:L-asparaginase / beta-aspartyl-peptidase